MIKGETMNNLTPLEFQNQRILTTQQLAEGYETESKRISENFSRNEERYQKGKHYFLLEGDDLKSFLQSSNCGLQNESKIRSLYLWTEKGALLHAKSLNTDKAWEMYDMLVETYFKAQQLPALDGLSPQMQALTQMVSNMALQELKVKQIEQKQQETARTLTAIKDTIIQRDDDWRDSINKMFNNAVQASGSGDYKSFRSETYQILEERARCNLAIRLSNMKDRLREAGATKTKIESLTRMDAIESDLRLKEIYTTIVKELSVRYVS